MSRNTLLALWGAATILGYLITFFFNISQAGTDAATAIPDPVPATEATAPVNDAATGDDRATDEVSTKSDTLSLDTGFPGGEDDTLATDTSSVGTVVPTQALRDSVLTGSVSPQGPDTSLADRPMPDDDAAPVTGGTNDRALPDSPAEIAADTTTVDRKVFLGILMMWLVVIAFPAAMAVVLSAVRKSEHLFLSVLWAVLVFGALAQNFWAIGASETVRAFSFYPLWFFVAALGFAVTAAKVDEAARTKLYGVAAAANLVFGIGLIVAPPLAGFAFLVAAVLQGSPMLLDPVVTARAQRAQAR